MARFAHSAWKIALSKSEHYDDCGFQISDYRSDGSGNWR
jgi:hypothetical protein